MPAAANRISSKAQSNHLYDVAIVGAGPGGSTAAHYLAAQGLDVLLLDKAEFPRDKTCGDGLTPRALHLLEDIGILQEATTAGFRVNGLELHARAGNMMQASVPDHPDYPDHMLILPRLKLDDIIRKKAISSGAKFESPIWVRDVETLTDRVLIHADQSSNKRKYQARVLILSVGANMRMLQNLGILTYSPAVLLAVRAYYEGMSGISDRIQVHFANVPQPGYGWVFPISESSANVGVGFWQSRLPWEKAPGSPRKAMADFLLNPKLLPLIKGAQQVGKIKSYPLRIDFATAPTFAERILLVGESAGLVSPLTGEGIDFAMESAQLAAGFLSKTFASGDFSRQAFFDYDRLLRQKFQRLFLSLNNVRRLYLNPLLMSRTITVSQKRSEIKNLLVNVMLSQRHPSEILNPRILRNILLGI